MSTAKKMVAKTGAEHPVLPRTKKVDLVDAYKQIAKRYPKVMAELAK
ncbi:MAG TPA: hypothetical protein VGS12_18190 [Caulobacteraceae bacterium]|nr:hypothetical protein [Caulobacteraceae bacterium]